MIKLIVGTKGSGKTKAIPLPIPLSKYDAERERLNVTIH